MIHKQKSIYAGKIVKIKKGIKHPQVRDFEGSDYLVEDWWDRVCGESWKGMNGHPACLIYAARTGFSATPIPSNDEVLYGKINGIGHLVHILEIEK